MVKYASYDRNFTALYKMGEVTHFDLGRVSQVRLEGDLSSGRLAAHALLALRGGHIGVLLPSCPKYPVLSTGLQSRVSGLVAVKFPLLQMGPQEQVPERGGATLGKSPLGPVHSLRGRPDSELTSPSRVASQGCVCARRKLAEAENVSCTRSKLPSVAQKSSGSLQPVFLSCFTTTRTRRSP